MSPGEAAGLGALMEPLQSIVTPLAPMMDENEFPATPVRWPAPRRRGLFAWWRQGLRTAFFLRPDWAGLRATPLDVAALVLVPWILSVLIERFQIVGPAFFFWGGLLDGWLDALVVLFACWAVSRDAPADEDSGRPGTASLFAMASAQVLPLFIMATLVFLPIVRSGVVNGGWHGPWFVLLASQVAWSLMALLVLVLRGSGARVVTRVALAALLVVSGVVHEWFDPTRHWYPLAMPASTDAESPPLKLTQDLLEYQPLLLASKLQALKPGRAGIVDVYAITFAPYASEDVFKRESQMVASVMRGRFGAEGRVLQLVNHRDTARVWPWATPLNLQRAIRRVAEVMDRDEDILFIHLTSHGASNGTLATEFVPLDIDPVTPSLLRRWLDEAGIRHRVISVSACYSGSWIEPLAEPGTLVMTAADADHTSFGCGHASTLTYFGRAMYDEQLRSTWSFEKAHAAARAVIGQREREAGKADGYSNPQIRVGEEIRTTLARLEAERAQSGQGEPATTEKTK